MRLSNRNFLKSIYSTTGSNKKFLIGVSGGIDSGVLLDLCSKNIPKNLLHCIHINHNINPTAKQNENFVKKKCYDKKIPLTIKSEKRTSFNGESMEMWGRRVRYRNYYKTLAELDFDFILTAHHANDNFETVLMNLDRGCFVRGLRGIIPKNKQIFRPLLPFNRSQIFSFAKKNKIEFFFDPSNDDTAIKRNYIRKKLIPPMNLDYDSVVQRFLNISKKAQNAIIKEQIVMTFIQGKLNKDENDFYIISDNELINFNIYFKMRLIKEIIGESDLPWSRHKYNSLKNFFQKNKVGSKLKINDKWMFLRNRNEWILNKNIHEKINVNVNEFGTYDINGRIISFKKTNKQKFSKDLSKELIDLDIFKNKEIRIRNWKNGDKFQPLGMNGSKKVSDYLIDKKVNMFNKNNQLVVTADHEIVWLCGHRLSDKFKVTDNTCNMMELSIY